MKKFLVAILALLYLTTSTGATVHMHYCMGKLIDWGFTHSKKDSCENCGMSKRYETAALKKERLKQEVTKTYTCPMHPDEVSSKPGNCSKCGMSLTLSSKEKMKLGYYCPMHPDVKSDKEGKCPNCGMALTPVKNNTKKSKNEINQQ